MSVVGLPLLPHWLWQVAHVAPASAQLSTHVNWASQLLVPGSQFGMIVCVQAPDMQASVVQAFASSQSAAVLQLGGADDALQAETCGPHVVAAAFSMHATFVSAQPLARQLVTFWNALLPVGSVGMHLVVHIARPMLPVPDASPASPLDPASAEPGAVRHGTRQESAGEQVEVAVPQPAMGV